MTYRRPTYLNLTVHHLVSAPSLHKIVVIWQGYKASHLDSQFRRLPKGVDVVIAGTNNVMNRWRRQVPTQTQAVFNIDDDTIINPADLEDLFMTWQKYQDRVIGLVDRVVYLDVRRRRYLYTLHTGVSSPEEYGLVIGKAWFASAKILDLAVETDPLVKLISGFLHNPHSEAKGCDDIAWNYFLHLKGVPPPIARLGVSMGSTETRQRKQSGYNASSDKADGLWGKYRHSCVTRLNELLNLTKPALPHGPLERLFASQWTAGLSWVRETAEYLIMR
eukprot:CAMPEP_0202337988 /NCGR_PEP_ID=MMETSP1126-20121109/450_1 /ASSEMBLY_ACC=CAM_ASM_000457 /TAXON_ID=3047 /ORGANISM="Dunaliella tertiolecta, Strain CCMP1320" /LENGTH=275 /DNA_ID=CAMNT_0048928289 /DNA_START=224 /DNA_END=1051 /DNA_ORIENTATION=+